MRPESWVAFELQQIAEKERPMGRWNTEADFWHKVEKADGDGCWLWTGPLNTTGYGQFTIQGERVVVHRFAYELCVGPIPEGLQLDHLCRVRRCVRSSHLEPVTQQENLRRGDGWAGRNARKTHCPSGHEYTPDNTYTDSNGGRTCVQCSPTARRSDAQRGVVTNKSPAPASLSRGGAEASTESEISDGND